ncbi:ATP-binding protein [Pseudothauera rhizosphaerae]|uniref:histidine kinase n=1 Tax=Pseudothauera rhizosphaerae TaxID=2565932 RepID=A0A4V3WAU0_9RHOO|nr:ATP-binding protein [Pseudothauera rhizosphaerae]THF60615.1 HAMP domain-containing protein [Pseudothauera rhizosphaerae]
MKLPLPRSLFARLMLIWLVGIALVLAVSFALFVGERDRVGRSALFEGIAQQIAATADVLDRLGPAERERWIEELGRRRLRLSLRPLPDHLRELPRNHPLVPALRAAMPERDIALYVHHRGEGPHGALLVTVRLADGSPLHVRLPGIPPTPEFSLPAPERLLSALLALVGGVLVLTWVAVRIATRPLSRMAEAARRLGEEPDRSPPLDTRGPTEVAQAAGAFNQMQQRVREHITERTRILAAISHDLQTPITRLRLRAEMVDDDDLRTRFQADLDAMQALIREGLDYARSRDSSAPLQPVDINGLLEALANDAAEMGWAVAVSGRAAAPCPAQPVALRRALWNLVENGIKFGERVDIDVEQTAKNTVLHIHDHGPGLPAEELEKVFEPFYRTESSRNRETGGTGLGLAIARNLLRAQGGEVSLANHPDGGLLATVTLLGGARPQASR